MFPADPLANARSAAGRPPERQTAIVKQLRRQIVEGALVPGTRLPNRAEMEQQFAASSITIQRALDQLVRDGFVCVRGRLGSFVVDAPPHLNRYAVIFPSHPGFQWGPFSRALLTESQNMLERNDRQGGIYFDFNGHEDSEDYQQLLRDLANDRVAGLIFTFIPFNYYNTPVFADESLPRVCIGTAAPQRLHTVETDVTSFAEKALDHVAARGCRTVAFMSSPSSFDSVDLDAALAARGLETRPYWRLTAGLDWSRGIRESAHLMFHAGQNERPDALIIGDDNLVEHATAGLVDAGVCAPDDVEIVAHCNFPHFTSSAVPVQWLGFDTREIVGSLFDDLDAQRRGESSPSLRKVTARFAQELAPHH